MNLKCNINQKEITEMTLDQLIDTLIEAQGNGMGDRDVVIPSQTGGSCSVTDVDADEDDFLIRLY